jgi:hypothetical protein
MMGRHSLVFIKCLFGCSSIKSTDCVLFYVQDISKIMPIFGNKLSKNGFLMICKPLILLITFMILVYAPYMKLIC